VIRPRADAPRAGEPLSPGGAAATEPADELLRRGRGLLRDRRTSQAESLLRRAAAEAPPATAGAALAELGRLWLERGDPEAAVAAFRSARSLRPDDPGVAVNLGVALRAGGDRDGAVVAYRSALALSPDLSQAHHNLGIALHDAGDLDGAIAAHRAAVAHAPGWAAAWNALGMAAKAQGDLREATRAFRRARRLAPGWHLPAHNLACLALDRGDLTAAREGFRRAVALEPTAATSRLNLALVLLKSGDLAAGWREYEWRWGGAVPPPERVGRPIWNGEPLAGRRILLSGEQGLGDTLMFARFAAPVRAAGGRPWLRCRRSLASLLETCPGVEGVVAEDEPLPAFELHCALGSLPHRLGVTSASMPAPVPYLRPPRARVPGLERLPPAAPGRLRVGIVWAAGAGHPRWRERSFHPRHLAPLARLPAVDLVSLQDGDRAVELADPGAPSAVDLSPVLGDFGSTAAFVARLDLVVTADTAMVHLAGALGHPTWLLLDRDCDWRWLTDRDDSPWYPSVRLFRQDRRGSWDEVGRRVADAAADWISPSGSHS
jgi:Flp pilus assembly protein TadD